MKFSYIGKTEQFGTAQCKKWRGEIFWRHRAIDEDLARGFLDCARPARKGTPAHVAVVESNTAGNTWLRLADEKLRFGSDQRTAAKDHDELIAESRWNSRNCESILTRWGSKKDLFEVAEKLQWLVEREGIEWPEKDSTDELTRVKNKLAACNRVCDPAWWKRNIKKETGRQVEQILRDAGIVRRGAQAYLSDWNYSRWKTSKRHNKGVLENLKAISDQGDEIVLSECVAASISNPINRRNELMTRMRGFEEVAQAMEMVGALFTLTAPSKYHARHHASGEKIENYNGETPAQVQKYLCNVWAKIRAKWARMDIKSFGFRVAEPHHDGTPHFHFVLFFSSKEILERAYKVFEDYALEEDGDEPGAKKARCNITKIDASKGTATGYIAKYISKNIDGAGMAGDVDLESGENFSDMFTDNPALRVVAWASLWGIRQFQQIGSVSVTVYRELRRVRESLESWAPAEVEAARAAADAGDWAEYVYAQGGPLVKRVDQLLRLVYDVRTEVIGSGDKEKTVERFGRYGDTLRRLIGIGLRRMLAGYRAEFCEQYCLTTREKEWEIRSVWSLAQRSCAPLDLCQ